MEFETEEFPRSLTEDILKYLEQQDYLCAEDDGLADNDQEYLHNVRHMIEQLIEKIASRAEYLEAYNAKLREHNQYPLFNLKELIPNFEIDDDLYNKLTFRETLVVGSFTSCPTSQLPTVVGGLCLDVQSAKGKNPPLRQQSGLSQSVVELITNLVADKRIGKKSLSDHELDKFIINLKPRYERTNCKFLVHLSSEFDVDGHQAGSRITAWVDRNFHTLEEKRQEFIIIDGEVNEKMLYVGIQPRRYYVKHAHTTTQLEDKKYYKMEDVSKMVCEGSNFLLMRYLAITRYVGQFELTTLYINGDICRNLYVSMH
ncbi:uncharacterized protein LOC116162270 [Photinus pyralis]|uniref:uncharacterized protein LOC116162269 n=1 Tax=Photinus pyralis TaxID=7054 RepID=UPI00126736D3|nr:uncharacterized protein LOC116162269 [Photinus pyralis]XP_031331732.1 uncharacterized protein LOC116162270 [Photinus pyralis]